MGSNPLHDVAVVFEEMWTKLVQHVRGDAVADAQKLVSDAKAQAASILSGATADVATDVASVEGDAAQLAGEAAGSVKSTSTPADPAMTVEPSNPSASV